MGDISIDHTNTNDLATHTAGMPQAQGETSSAKTREKDAKSWPIILNSLLASSSFGKIFKSKSDKVRTSENLSRGTVLFPMAKTAFLLVEISEKMMSQLKEATGTTPVSQLTCDIIQRIDKHASRHANSYVVLMAGLFTDREMEVVELLQIRYMTSRMQGFLYAHNAEEAVNVMMKVAWMQSPPVSTLMSQKFCEVMAEQVQGKPLRKLSEFDQK